MSNDQELLKIGEFATRANTNLRTLRYYEELALLVPAERSTGGFRYYRPADVNRVRMIHDLQALGLSLETIRDLLSSRNQEQRKDWLRKVAAALEEQQRLIRTRIAMLETQQRGIGDALAQVQHYCNPCDSRPHENNNFCDPCRKTGAKLPDFLSALF
ncbi:MAG: MerR family transcriptional regulator [bacterium]|nr:MerR family transcriptional regulator [bacterium]